MASWSTYICVYVGHTVDVAAFLDLSLLSDLADAGVVLTVDPIQAPQVVICGWLLGTFTNTNCTHFGKSVQSHPCLTTKDGRLLPILALKLQAIKERHGAQESGQQSKPVKAVHILCNATLCKATTAACKSIWNWKITPDISCNLPDGCCLHFVESRANRHDAPLEGRLAKRHAQCYIKQRRFLRAHATVPIDNIQELNSPLYFKKVDAHLTLCQVFLTTKT